MSFPAACLVDVALGEILELRRFLAELEQDLKAVECSLELANLLRRMDV